MKPLLDQAAGLKASTVKVVVVDPGDAIGVVRPIGVTAACTVCHGTSAKRPALLKAALATQYPIDQAVGFEEGDFRGFFRAEVPKGGGKQAHSPDSVATCLCRAGCGSTGADSHPQRFGYTRQETSPID